MNKAWKHFIYEGGNVTNTKLEESRDDLHSATDELNVAIVRAEDAIAQLKLGVTAGVLFNMNDDDLRLERRLCFGKMGDRWRFIVEVHGLHETSDPLLNMSRRVRIRATHLFKDLFEELQRAVGRDRDEIVAARERVETFIMRVRNAKAAAE